MSKDEPEIIEENTNSDIPDVEEVVPDQDPDVVQQVPVYLYYLTKITVAYKRDNAMRSRSVNVLVRSDTLGINRSLLNNIQNNAVGRVLSENKVKANDIRDVIVDAIMVLGQFTEEEFLAENSKITNMGPDEITERPRDEEVRDNVTEIPQRKG